MPLGFTRCGYAAATQRKIAATYLSLHSAVIKTAGGRCNSACKRQQSPGLTMEKEKVVMRLRPQNFQSTVSAAA